MRKILRYSDAITLFCGTLGMLLQFWIRMDGTDALGLYPANHPCWILCWILSVAMLAFIWLLTRQAGNNRSYKANFTASTPGAIGCALAAIALIFTAIQGLQNSLMYLDTLAGIVGLLSGAGLLVAAVCRFLGRKPHFLCYMLPCIFFALHVFYLGRELGGEPEPVRYMFRFLATLSLIPACYQLWGFCVSSGDRQKCLFWSLLSGFLCILSAPGDTESLLYLALGIWLLSNTCVLKYLPKRTRPTVQPEQAEEAESEPILTTPEIPSTMSEDLLPTQEASTDESDVPTDTPQPAAEPEEELDVDAIIAEILREIDSNVQ